tara:strand:+ start:2539 stop:3558 length:1020 start_codon:yes stop_codon:yes gene_type:complete
MDNSSNWIKLNRTLLQWEWYGDINTKVVFLHLLLIANFKDRRWRGLELKAGSCVSSVEKLANEVGMSTMKMRTALKKLHNTNEVTSETSSQGTIIQVVNWLKFQEVTNEQQTSNKRVTNEQQTSNKRITYIEEGKKVKKERKKEDNSEKIIVVDSKGNEHFYTVDWMNEEIIKKLGCSIELFNSQIIRFENWPTIPKGRKLTGTVKAWIAKEMLIIKNKRLDQSLLKKEITTCESAMQEINSLFDSTKDQDSQGMANTIQNQIHYGYGHYKSNCKNNGIKQVLTISEWWQSIESEIVRGYNRRDKHEDSWSSEQLRKAKLNGLTFSDRDYDKEFPIINK